MKKIKQMGIKKYTYIFSLPISPGLKNIIISYSKKGIDIENPNIIEVLAAAPQASVTLPKTILPSIPLLIKILLAGSINRFSNCLKKINEVTVNIPRKIKYLISLFLISLK